MERTVGDIVETLYGTARVLKILESGVLVKVFRPYSMYDIGIELILER